MENQEILKALTAAFHDLRLKMKQRFNRHVSLPDLLTDRWETARYLGFGTGSTCYNNVLVLGDVQVGRDTWIGPNVILDGSGGLEIGDFCSISSGVQIYSHHTVNWSNSLGNAPIDRAPTKIGNGVYVGPSAVIQMGCTIGDKAVIGALSLVQCNVPASAKAYGVPARVRLIE